MTDVSTVSSAPAGRTTPEQIDNHRLTGHQKLAGLTAVVNRSVRGRANWWREIGT